MLAGTLLSGVLLAGCAINEPPLPADYDGATGIYNASGSSAQEAAQSAWIGGYQTVNPGITVNYSPVGSGAGRANFLEGWTAFAGSDAALKEDELAEEALSCTPGTSPIDLPVYISPIAVAFSVEGVDELRLDPATLAAVFSGAITRWDDPALAALNPDAELPAENITVVHRSDDSGTTENFTDYLHATAPEVWTEEPSDTFAYRFAGADANQGNSGVVDAIRNGRNAIGYADASKTGGLDTAAIRVGDDFVDYTSEAAAAAVAASPFEEGRAEHDLAIALDRTSTEPGIYPLVLVSYVVACQSYRDADTAAFVTDYLDWVVSEDGQRVAAEAAGSSPLAPRTAAAVQAAIDSITSEDAS